MRKSRYTDEQIIGFIKRRAKFRAMYDSDAKRLRDLEVENNRLNNLLAETVLDNEALKVAFGAKR